MPDNNTNPDVPFPVRIPLSDLNELKAIASESNVSLSQIGREAAQDLIKKKRSSKKAVKPQPAA